MVFSSVLFLFLFLPVFLLLYFISPSKLKNLILLLFSLLFYTWGEGELVLLLLVSTLVDFSCGRIIERGLAKTGLAVSIVFNLLLLLSFKYIDFAFENFNQVMGLFGVVDSKLLALPHVALPIGISFYTFQTMSYTIDVYRKEVKASRDILEFATYVTMFPQLVAGPIVRYIDVQTKLKNREHTVNQIASGVERFMIGFAKKVLIANTFATIADSIFAVNISDLSTPMAWLGILAYAFQIYYDFSGYSDMAIGLGRIMGFNFPENFNFPYIAKSIKDFWRRWHISLSTWFRDYLYISLGGSRQGNSRTYLNLFIVFAVTGLWHGSSWNFIVWGLFHGFFLIIERLGFDKVLERLNPFLQRLYTMLVVLVAWVFFRADNLAQAIAYLKQMFIPSTGLPAQSEYLTLIHVNMHTLFFGVLAVLFAMPSHGLVKNWFVERRLDFVHQIGLLVIFIAAICYVSAGTYNPFIYFRF